MTQFTQKELRDMIEEYQETSRARQEFLALLWEIAKERYLDGIR